MANQKGDKPQHGSQQSVNKDRDRKNDPERTSNQGRKEASGGRTDTNNRGHVKGGSERM
ncbi:hypothetical protein [Flaviaesturariibacter amylovorans]|uniref:Stress-induced protein n=1 Tax=Flaviaesturariibacter amylovorans TaxID=1084520 RepID=A0ABP8HB84_9BACT